MKLATHFSVIKFILISFLFVNVEKVNSQNASDCFNMYINKTINIPCVDNSTCCFVQYTNYDQNFTRCMLKLNSTENLCDDFSETISYYHGSLSICDCFTKWINNKFILFFIVLLYILVIFS